MVAAWLVAGVLALVPAAQSNPLRDLQRLEQAATAAPQAPGPRFALGRLLAEWFADERAIDELNRALQLGLRGNDAIEAHYWIGWVALWTGRDREAMAAFQEVQRTPIPADIVDEALQYAQGRQQMAVAQVAAIRESHRILAGVGAAQGRTIALLVIMGLGIIGMFWGGRRLARTQAGLGAAPPATPGSPTPSPSPTSSPTPTSTQT